MSDSNPSTPERFPDLYSLLGIEPLERDAPVIEQALRRLASQIQAGANATDAAQRQRVERARKLFEFGKQQLLDPQRKQRYDRQWQALYGQAVARSGTKQASELTDQSAAKNPTAVGAPASPSSQQTSTWDLRELRTLLPSGDPHAPFRAAEYYAASGTAALNSRYQEDFAKLRNLLTPTSVSTLATDVGVGEREGPSSEPASSQSFSARKIKTPAISQPVSEARLVISTAARLRKKRERGLLWGAVSALSALGVVLGIAYWLMQPASNSTLAAKPVGTPAAISDPTNSLLPAADPVADRSSPRRSGLPSVPGFDSTAVVPGMPAPSDTNSSDTMPAMPNRVPTMDRDAEMVVDVAPADNPSVPRTVIEMEPELVPEPVSLTAGEREQWSSAMLAVRKAIGQQQYAEAAQQLDDARSLAKTPQQTEQLARLVTVEQLAQEFGEALHRAIDGMKGAETFIVGKSTPVSFVEASPDRLTLRVEGQNQSWSMTDLPIGIAYSLVDMSMDREHPRSLAAKAAFTLVHPAAQGKELASQRAEQMMSTAIEAGAVSKDMAQVFTDDYQLP
ncbi:MAG: hypothetical protein IT422_00850 [Pirellulaceae bacterium]|nr:hypothetical protein [Pirellulaceae bacterium]